MITFFAIPKPFVDHEAIIQSNAVQSWERMHPDTEVLLFGDEKGIGTAANELKATHRPHLERNANGTPFLDKVFDEAQNTSINDSVCYVNGDIILFQDMLEALERVRSSMERFLIVGRRIDLDITERVDLAGAGAMERIRSLAESKGHLAPMNNIDYFLFPKGMLLDKMLPLLVGRPFWDNWMIWNVRNMGIPVIDASEVITAVHQNHGRSWHVQGSLHADEGWDNYRLIGSGLHMYSIEQATHYLTAGSLSVRRGHKFDRSRIVLGKVWNRISSLDFRKPSDRR